jgi:hypothetical protein
LTPDFAKLSISPESSDGFASVGTVLPKEEVTLLPGGLFSFAGWRFWGAEPFLGTWVEMLEGAVLAPAGASIGREVAEALVMPSGREGLFLIGFRI